jgi:hypothetical protein
VGWLQRALDYFYKQFPIKGVLTSATVSLASEFLTVPLDFVQDYRNGLIMASDGGRLTRRGLSYLLSKAANNRGKPSFYAIVDDTRLMLRDIPDTPYSATLWYYKLPDALTSTQIPPFPDDQVLVDLLEIKYKEWLQIVPKGSGMEYARQQIAALQKSGVGAEPEPDQIELDRQYYGDQNAQRDDWMGESHL